MTAVLSGGGVGTGGPGQPQRGIGAARHPDRGRPGPGPQGRAAAVRTAQGERPAHGPLHGRRSGCSPNASDPIVRNDGVTTLMHWSFGGGGSKVAFTRSLDPPISEEQASFQGFGTFSVLLSVSWPEPVSESFFRPFVHKCLMERLFRAGAGQ